MTAHPATMERLQAYCGDPARAPAGLLELMSAHACAESFGHQEIHGLAQQFVAAVTEQLFDLGVDQNDFAKLVDHDYGVGSGFK